MSPPIITLNQEKPTLHLSVHAAQVVPWMPFILYVHNNYESMRRSFYYNIRWNEWMDRLLNSLTSKLCKIKFLPAMMNLNYKDIFNDIIILQRGMYMNVYK